MPMAKTDQVVGSLLGAAVGDALGLPYEGLSARRARSMLGAPVRYRLLFARGMVSDDTEHACMTAQALLVAGDDVGKFRISLAWRLRWWFLGLPAGIGFATLRSILRLWVGVPSTRNGVFSAGNGPAMRAGILGSAIGDTEKLKPFVIASTRLTHSDPKAEFGACAVALAAQMASSSSSRQVDGAEYHACLVSFLPPDAHELLRLIESAVVSVESRQSTPAYARQIGLERGVTGNMYHTVPVAIHAWLAHQLHFEGAVVSAIECGGDTDTVASIVGAIAGAACGKDGIPEPWRKNLVEWPRSATLIETLGARLGASVDAGRAGDEVALFIPAVVLRNVVFLVVVLFHGFRRLLPPYH
jgi:ADP-ribosylglycohydrolase